MQGKFVIQLGAEQLVSGMSSSDYATDGALGTSSVGINPFITPGVMYGLASPTDISTNLSGNIIASCEDSNAVSPNNRYFIDDAASAANYYSFNGTTVTKVKTGTSTGTTYVSGKTDFISFNGNFYASSPTVLNKWDGSSTLTEAYQTFGDANAMHPMLIYQGLLWFGDGNTLSTLTTGGAYTASVLTLSSKEKIIALGIDPSTGLMMISIQTVYDTADTIPSLKAVYLFDGISTKPARKILVDDMITAFYNLEGSVYVGAGQTLGVWNGNGVTFLRKFANVTLSNTDLAYKHHFTNTRNILHVIDGQNVLSYGAPVSPKKGFFYTAYNTSGNGHISCIMPVGSNRIAIAWATNKLFSFDFSSSSAGTPTLYFNNIYFPRPVFIRFMRIITTGITATGVNGIGNILLFDEKGNSFSSQRVSGVGFTTPGFFSPASTTTRVSDLPFSFKCMGVQPYFTSITQNFGIIRVYIYYDIAE